MRGLGDRARTPGSGRGARGTRRRPRRAAVRTLVRRDRGRARSTTTGRRPARPAGTRRSRAAASRRRSRTGRWHQAHWRGAPERRCWAAPARRPVSTAGWWTVMAPVRAGSTAVARGRSRVRLACSVATPGLVAHDVAAATTASSSPAIRTGQSASCSSSTISSRWLDAITSASRRTSDDSASVAAVSAMCRLPSMVLGHQLDEQSIGCCPLRRGELAELILGGHPGHLGCGHRGHPHPAHRLVGVVARRRVEVAQLLDHAADLDRLPEHDAAGDRPQAGGRRGPV